MSKSSLITVLALIASVSAKPYFYGYPTLPYTPHAAYTAAEVLNPAAPLPTYPYAAALPAAYSSAYSVPYSAYSASYAAPVSLPALPAVPAVPSYTAAVAEEYPALINAAAPAPLVYSPPYSYFYKR